MRLKRGYAGVIQGHGLISMFLFALIWTFFDSSRAMSFGLGCAIIWVNWWVLGLSWRQLQGKKPIALSAALIVIKYPLLIVVCLLSLRQPWLWPIWFATGIATVIPAGFWATRIGLK